jgi:ribosomal protein L44E
MDKFNKKLRCLNCGGNSLRLWRIKMIERNKQVANTGDVFNLSCGGAFSGEKGSNVTSVQGESSDSIVIEFACDQCHTTNFLDIIERPGKAQKIIFSRYRA